MGKGIMAGILWALDTVVLGMALAMSPFGATEQAVFLAPFVSTFFHDVFSSLWMLIYMGIRGRYRGVIRAVKTKSGKFIMLGALLGGPIGMSGYVAAIHYIGPAYTAVISALFPALGALFSYIFLKEKMLFRQMAGLAVSILGVILLGYDPNGAIGENVILGFACALLCCVGWAAEAVICAYGMKDPCVSNADALTIRQIVSAVFYGGIIISLLKGWEFTARIAVTKATVIILVAALFGTASYLCYYGAINKIGATKAMALNITYSAWAIIFSFMILGTLPDKQALFAGIMIVGGSIVAAAEYKSKATD